MTNDEKILDLLEKQGKALENLQAGQERIEKTQQAQGAAIARLEDGQKQQGSAIGRVLTVLKVLHNLFSFP